MRNLILILITVLLVSCGSKKSGSPLILFGLVGANLEKAVATEGPNEVAVSVDPYFVDANSVDFSTGESSNLPSLIEYITEDEEDETNSLPLKEETVKEIANEVNNTAPVTDGDKEIIEFIKFPSDSMPIGSGISTENVFEDEFKACRKSGAIYFFDGDCEKNIRLTFFASRVGKSSGSPYQKIGNTDCSTDSPHCSSIARFINTATFEIPLTIRVTEGKSQNKKASISFDNTVCYYKGNGRANSDTGSLYLIDKCFRIENGEEKGSFKPKAGDSFDTSFVEVKVHGGNLFAPSYKVSISVPITFTQNSSFSAYLLKSTGSPPSSLFLFVGVVFILVGSFSYAAFKNKLKAGNG